MSICLFKKIYICLLKDIYMTAKRYISDACQIYIFFIPQIFVDYDDANMLMCRMSAVLLLLVKQGGVVYFDK